MLLFVSLKPTGSCQGFEAGAAELGCSAGRAGSPAWVAAEWRRLRLWGLMYSVATMQHRYVKVVV